MPKTTSTDAYQEMLAILIAARRTARMSQASLSEILGKPQPWVSNVETGVRRIDVIEFCGIARGLGREPGELFAELAQKLPPSLVI